MPEQPKKKLWILALLLLLIILFIKLVSLHANWIENYYTSGLYPFISGFLRFDFGWIPFSIGDLLYTAVGIYLLVKISSLVKRLLQRRFSLLWLRKAAGETLVILALVYIAFNVLWGLNYNRLGIAYQLKLTPVEHNKEDLREITSLLIMKVNESRRKLENVIVYPSWKETFKKSEAAYYIATKSYPFLQYQKRSIKKSMYGRAGNYFGFLGYYNPFTGEAQLNLTQPKFLIPYVTCHEMAHQLGYASEEEANFAGYLAAVNSPDTLFHYSVYFDLFNYANRELFLRDSIVARENYKRLDTLVKTDVIELRNFYKKYKNPLAPLIHIFYDQYLKANQQSKGIESYDYVVSLLISYYRKYGKI